jgi:drug/metabolite transporter (DMT)-like permease
LRRPLDLKGGLFAFLLSTLWAGNPIATKTALEDAPPLRFGWMRFGLGLVVMLVWAAVTRQTLKVQRHELRPMATLGLLFAVQLAFLNFGQDYTTASHAVIINTTYPLWTGILAHFMIPGDRMTRVKLMGTLIAYGGVVVLFWKGLGGGTGTLLGDGLTLISAILLAERQIYISKSSHTLSVPKLLLAQGVIGIAAFLTFSFMIERDPWAWDGEFALAMLYTGVVIAGFGFIGTTWLLTRYLPSGVTVVSFSQPVVGIVLSWWLLDEAIGPELYAGAALVVAGSFIAQRPARPASAARAPGAAPRAPDPPQPGGTR